jgi:phenylpropionate dioxygenase-like ring-hydroxylating dioxygenase large terminal subunit
MLPSEANEQGQDFVPRADYIYERTGVLERDRLWPQTWQNVCREEEIPNVGDYVLYEILDQSFIVVRTSRAEISVFYNVCSHRGRLLKTEYRGNIRQGITCAFHGWHYKVDGTLANVPNRAAWHSCSSFDDKNLGLKSPQVGRWGGWVWINMNLDAPPLAEYLSPVNSMLRNFEFESMRIRKYYSLHVPVDWKIVLEAFMEGYHTGTTHQQMVRFGGMDFPSTEAGLHSYHGARMLNPSSSGNSRDLLIELVIELNTTLHAIYLETSVEAAQRLRAEVAVDATPETVVHQFWGFQREALEKKGANWPAKLSHADLEASTYHVFPNMILLPAVDGALVYRLRPDPAVLEGCVFDILILDRLIHGQSRQTEREVYPSLESFRGRNPFLEQDFSNLIAVSRGVRSRAWAGAPTNPVEERTISNFHRNLRRFLFQAQ